MFRVAQCIHTTYKVLISPLLGNRCRFTPSCSDYALEAVEQRGYMVGTLLAIGRIMRCHPFCEGGYDPVPLKKELKRQS